MDKRNSRLEFSGCSVALSLCAATDVAVFLYRKRTEVGISIVSIATFEGLMVIQSVQPMTVVTLSGRSAVD